MPKFGKTSQAKLDTCTQANQNLYQAVVSLMDCSIVEGHRSNERQTELYKKGASKKKAGESLHNTEPSQAVDCVPYVGRQLHGAIPKELTKVINDAGLQSLFSDTLREYYHIGKLNGVRESLARSMGYDYRGGDDWNQDGNTLDTNFFDAAHGEIR